MTWGNTVRDSGNIPLGSVGVPGDTTPQPLQGGQEYTDANSNITAPAMVALSGSTWKATYTYAVLATAPYATPTDWVVIRGVAGKVIEIARVELSGAATAATEVVYTLKKHTIANTAGTSTNPTPMQHDSNDAGPPANVVFLYSAAPTIDATATIFKSIRLDLDVAPAASTVAVDRYIYDAQGHGKPITLRGVAQELAINLGGGALPAGTVLDLSITLTII